MTIRPVAADDHPWVRQVVVLLSLREGARVATRLIDRAARIARETACRRMWLVTTNDNLAAIAFYRARGWRQAAVRRGAVSEARRLKPEIPAFGTNGLPKEDELQFELSLDDRDARWEDADVRGGSR